jgi:AmiR/NasT family two-component response regulator
MAQYRLDDEAAFVKLRDHSRELNMKVRTLAEEIVAHHNRGCGPSK